MDVRRRDAVLHALPSFFLLLLLLLNGCGSDYTILSRETVVEVVKEVEIPVYIEVEVDSPAGDVWVDSFIQSSSVNGIDILWVIDTSGSMNDDETALLNGIAAMMAALPPAGWRLVMIPATPGNASQSQQFPLVPGDDIYDAEVMLGSMLRGGGEAGFESVYDYIIDNPYSNTWMRYDAALLVVFVSDEEEQSSPFPNVSDFTSWYGNLRPSVFLSSIINLPEGLSSCHPNPAHVGDRYMEATQYFNGVVIDICGADWGPGVSAASSLVEPIEELPLTHPPLEDTVRVFIDGQLDSQWTYDPVGNRVFFTIIPPGGSLVEIGYIIDPATVPSE